jgi:putative endonuclease
MTTLKKERGQLSEDLVASFLKKNGFTIISRNFTVRSGEIDIVARKEKVFHFVEVKSIKDGQWADLSEIVSKSKRRRICSAALIFAKQKNIMDQTISFDVAAVTNDKVNMYYGAFLLGE